jgi:hypothetical protein
LTPASSAARVRRLFALGQLEAGLDLLTARCESLARKVREGDEAAWARYVAVLSTIVAVLERLDGQRERGDVLTTKELAQKLGMRPDSLLRCKRRGLVTPAVAHGKFIRWRAEDGLR